MQIIRKYKKNLAQISAVWDFAILSYCMTIDQLTCIILLTASSVELTTSCSMTAFSVLFHSPSTPPSVTVVTFMIPGVAAASHYAARTQFWNIKHIKERYSSKKITHIVFGRSSKMRTKYSQSHPFPLCSARINTVEICYDFSPSKPVPRNDSSLRRGPFLQAFMKHKAVVAT